VILAAGIKVVVARSFSRTFYRNAVNNGLVPIECDTSKIAEGDQLSIALDDTGLRVADRTSGVVVSGPPPPRMMMDILSAGGLVEYVRRGGWTKPVSSV
jgi:3-isopropylmalate/(R)-2-methylmalate dehydratase small subunit